MDMTQGTSNGPFTIISTGDIDNDGKEDLIIGRLASASIETR